MEKKLKGQLHDSMDLTTQTQSRENGVRTKQTGRACRLIWQLANQVENDHKKPKMGVTFKDGYQTASALQFDEIQSNNGSQSSKKKSRIKVDSRLQSVGSPKQSLDQQPTSQEKLQITPVASNATIGGNLPRIARSRTNDLQPNLLQVRSKPNLGHSGSGILGSPYNTRSRASTRTILDLQPSKKLDEPSGEDRSPSR